MNIINKITKAMDEADLLEKLSLRYKLIHFIKTLSLQDSAFHLCSASTYCYKKYRFKRRN